MNRCFLYNTKNYNNIANTSFYINSLCTCTVSVNSLFQENSI